MSFLYGSAIMLILLSPLKDTVQFYESNLTSPFPRHFLRDGIVHHLLSSHCPSGLCHMLILDQSKRRRDADIASVSALRTCVPSRRSSPVVVRPAPTDTDKFSRCRKELQHLISNWFLGCEVGHETGTGFYRITLMQMISPISIYMCYNDHVS